MKRFWDEATSLQTADGWQVMLDGKPVRIPTGPPLTLPNAAIASAVAAEWQTAGGAKGGEMSYADLPITRLAGTAQERVAPDPTPVALELARYGESDLLCYRAPHPPGLADLQARDWQPWLDWAEARFGARLVTTSGLAHVVQSPAALAALAAATGALPPLALAAMGVAVPSLGSLVLALALAEGALDAAEAHRLAQLDETFQASLWGRDAEAEARWARMAEEVAVAGVVLEAMRG